MEDHRSIYASRATLTAMARGAREKLVLSFFCLLSLACAAYFLTTLKTAQASANNYAAPPSAVMVKSALADEAAAPATVGDVVAKANAFKALLTSAQLAVLEQPYTTTLARRWSNLPCGSSCRNGIQLGSLNAEQLAAALEVIRAAAGTTVNEGSDEFNQTRLADTVLAAQGGGGGPGGGGYGEGIYFLAFLNTPSTTGAWMMQFGGHHYGANIAYNQGHVVGTTPLFEAIEPLTFTVNGTAYAPLQQERDALANALASLDATQLTAARLSNTFGDVTLSPGESNGGNGTFPTTKVGIAVSSLSDAQKQLVLAAMRPWVLDMDDVAAANLLRIYESELNGTFISFTGNGTSGNASSFLNANTNYARIDGPSVWIEFICQNGVIFRNQIHYHTVWRDRNRDYGKDLSLTVPLDIASVTTTSAASYAAGTLAPEAIGALFGTGLAASAESASTTTLPTTLGGVQLQVTDAAGMTRNAPLFFVAPTQINFQVPPGTSAGAATLSIVRDGATVGQGTLTIESVTPGLFAANANGQGVAAAVVLRVRADGTQSFEPVAQFNAASNSFENVPIDLGAATDQLFLIAYGTGLRNRSALSAVTATIGGANANVSFAGAQGDFTGLDQLNLAIPRSLAGRGIVDVVVGVDGKTANTVTINTR